MKYITKTAYLAGLKCPKLLWYLYNRPEDIPPPMPQMEAIRLEGQRVGLLAQKLFPGAQFEREFKFGNSLARADIIDGQALIEVKSSVEVKEDHYYDVAFQKYVCEGSGFMPDHCGLLHLNKEYVKRGEIEIERLFTLEDISTRATQLQAEVEGYVEYFLKVIAGPEPDFKVGEHCRNDCPMLELCFKFLPEENVMLLRGHKNVAYHLLDQGIFGLSDIPAGYDLNPKHGIQVQSHRTKHPYVHQPAMGSFLKRLRYPLYFLDFETIGPAVPIYDLSRPFEEITVQFSLHVVDHPGAKPEHYEYLAPGDIDPRPEILKRLKDLLGQSGSIVAYNASYENNRIKESSQAYPEYADWFTDISPRFLDLYYPFKQFFVYHPEQMGSASMKNVLPALTGISYDELVIKDGFTARNEYQRIAFDPLLSEEEKEKVRRALLTYCELDTFAMIAILNKLVEFQNKAE